VFVAVRGQRADGAMFAGEAARRGAAAIISETPAPAGWAETPARAGIAVPWIRTPDARLALAELSGIFYGHPSEALTVVGVTGTNGKTTSTYLLAAVMDAAGLPCGRMGTVTVRVGPSPSDERDASHTTPEAPERTAAARNGRPRVQGLCNGSLVTRSSCSARRPALQRGHLPT
jgi:UDP-N-acetylmuramyl tripeptide synthase